jgi:hypothetical protein
VPWDGRHENIHIQSEVKLRYPAALTEYGVVRATKSDTIIKRKSYCEIIRAAVTSQIVGRFGHARDRPDVAAMGILAAAAAGLHDMAQLNKKRLGTQPELDL